ncbi:MAG TPA: Dickkopf N-terminal cysteine-rich domain-containing protein, partial [Polyangiales bacterium]|nr:Dickkopf N-terminal cysteine-rich domain-containing protein [Polyangiales bacterium]
AYTELENRASKCDTSVAQWGGSIDGLRGILKGSIEPKASCMPSATLDPVQVGAALVACAQPETHACVYATLLDPWTCEPRSAEGGVCVTDNNCIDGLYCFVQTPGIAGMCKQRKAVGESCASPTECSSLFCKKSKCVEADQQAAYCLIN